MFRSRPDPPVIGSPTVEAKVLLVANAASRQGDEAGDAVERALVERGATVARMAGGRAEKISPWIVANAGGAAHVTVVGGDGTANAAAAGLVEAGLPLHLVPAGTANDLGRTLGLPTDTGEAAALPWTGRLKTIDLAEANGCLFFNVASIGLSVELARRLTRERKRRFGRLSYLIAAVQALSAMRPFRARLIHHGVTESIRTLQIAVGNGRYYGGGMAVHEDAAIDDGMLDLYSLELTRMWKLIAMYPAFKQGRHGLWREVRASRGPEFRIETRRPREVNLDGEIRTQTPVTFRVRPRALRVFVPRD